MAVATNVHQSRLSTRARIDYADLVALADEQIPSEHSDNGQQKTCKKVIGLKVCGTARWKYTVAREGQIQISGQDDFVIINVPMRFFGDTGIRGDVAKVLKINAMDFSGALNAQLRLKIDVNESWCPSLQTEITYQWTVEPHLEWVAGIDVNLRDKADKAIRKQLAGLQQSTSDAIDCNKFREAIQAQWKPHNIPLELPDNNAMYLNIMPNGFSFSGVKTETEKLGLAFSLDAQTSVQSHILTTEPQALPALTRSEYQPGSTQFNVLIRAAYSQLSALADQHLSGKVFTESSTAGEVSVTINSVILSGNPNGLTMNVEFSAKLPGKKLPVPGTVYLTATPVLDAFTQTVRLKNISLSNVLDSTLWNTLAAVFNKKIIAELEEKAEIDLGPELTKLSTMLESQLADPTRTAGLNFGKPEVTVILESLVPEQSNLAAVVRVETQLDIEVPVKDLFQKHVKR
ncbi:MAG: DUF4403 family protein [Gammaproteobacteria bacterium]|nr:DUF4403 family protein [Gammaproteobacteria bacterium]